MTSTALYAGLSVDIWARTLYSSILGRIHGGGKPSGGTHRPIAAWATKAAISNLIIIIIMEDDDNPFN